MLSIHSSILPPTTRPLQAFSTLLLGPPHPALPPGWRALLIPFRPDLEPRGGWTQVLLRSRLPASNTTWTDRTVAAGRRRYLLQLAESMLEVTEVTLLQLPYSPPPADGVVSGSAGPPSSSDPTVLPSSPSSTPGQVQQQGQSDQQQQQDDDDGDSSSALDKGVIAGIAIGVASGCIVLGLGARRGGAWPLASC